MAGAPPPTPVPATVEAPHPALGGSNASPPSAHAAGQAQGVGGAAPPVQKKPEGQSAPVIAVDPAPQARPGGAAQGPEQAAVARPLVFPKVPTGQGSVAPPAQYAPTGHSAGAPPAQ